MDVTYTMVIVGAVCVGLIIWFLTNESMLSKLPSIYYVLAIFCGITILGFAIANKHELNSLQVGTSIGYTVGTVLSMFAVGRVIQLLQQIRDAVRTSLARSPSRPDDE